MDDGIEMVEEQANEKFEKMSTKVLLLTVLFSNAWYKTSSGLGRLVGICQNWGLLPNDWKGKGEMKVSVSLDTLMNFGTVMKSGAMLPVVLAAAEDIDVVINIAVVADRVVEV